MKFGFFKITFDNIVIICKLRPIYDNTSEKNRTRSILILTMKMSDITTLMERFYYLFHILNRIVIIKGNTMLKYYFKFVKLIGEIWVKSIFSIRKIKKRILQKAFTDFSRMFSKKLFFSISCSEKTSIFDILLNPVNLLKEGI